MTEITPIKRQGLTTLDGLAAEARLYSESILMNMIQLGRVLQEAKKLVKHGEWSKWVKENAGCSERTAQQFMQGYIRFGGNALFSNIDKSKLFKMIALEEGTENAFMEENDVASMSAREVEAAVKVFKHKYTDACAMSEHGDTPQALPDTTPDAPPSKKQLEPAKPADSEHGMLAMLEELRAENAQYRTDLQEITDLLRQSEEEKHNIQDDLLDTKSSIARGDTGIQTSVIFTLDMFGAAVRQFIGVCARLPHMGQTFNDMTHDEREQYDQLLRTMEAWTKDTRFAMDTMIQEGIIK